MKPATFLEWLRAHEGEAWADRDLQEIADAYAAEREQREARYVAMEPHCPHGESDGRRCQLGACPVVESPEDVLRMVAAREPLPGTLGETAKRYAVAELARRAKP